MTMIAPCDANQAKKLLRKSFNYKGSIDIHIPRGEEPAVYDENYDYDYKIGKAIVLNEGKNLTIIATGMEVYNAVQVAKELEKEGFDVGVIDMHTIKPIDKDAIIEAEVPARLKKIGVPDCFVEIGYPEELYPYYKMDVKRIVETALEFLKQ